MSKEIIYEDDIIIVYGEYDPASHIYDNDEININVSYENILCRS